MTCSKTVKVDPLPLPRAFFTATQATAVKNALILLICKVIVGEFHLHKGTTLLLTFHVWCFCCCSVKSEIHIQLLCECVWCCLDLSQCGACMQALTGEKKTGHSLACFKICSPYVALSPATLLLMDHQMWGNERYDVCTDKLYWHTGIMLCCKKGWQLQWSACTLQILQKDVHMWKSV